MKTFFASILSLTIFLSLGVAVVGAEPQAGGNTTPQAGGNIGSGINIKLDNPFKTGGSLFDLLKNVVNNIILPIGGVLAVLAFIYSGFLYVMAQGNDAKLKEAHSALLYTAIGTAVLLGSWVLANVIKTTVEQIRV